MELVIGFLVAGLILVLCLGFGKAVEQATRCVFRRLPYEVLEA